MSSKKNRPYQKKSFESSGVSSDTSANIYVSMLLSPAWIDLSAQQQRLYLYCKAQYYAEKTKPMGNPEYFTMNQSKWAELYQIYKRSNAASFYRDMEALIEHGFIRCVECGSTTRTKTIYAYSSLWQQYGTDSFVVPFSDMTSAMIRRKRKESCH